MQGYHLSSFHNNLEKMASIALYVTPERLSIPKTEHFHALEGKMKAILVVASTNKGGI